MVTAGVQIARPPEFIKLLANDLRWALLKALTVGDYQVNELVEQVQQPMNLVSYHLKKMRDDALITMRRSEADGRDVYYSLDLDRLHVLFLNAGMALHPSLGVQLPTVDVAHVVPQRVLFVCTHNSARSQMAEGLLRSLSKGHLEVYSAGSHPTSIHPDAIRIMDLMDIDIRGQKPTHFRELEDQSFDVVITVCDKAREICPTFPGKATQLHWGFADPSAIEDKEQRLQAFEQTARKLKSRIGYFLSTLPLQS